MTCIVCDVVHVVNAYVATTHGCFYKLEVLSVGVL